jgi:F0F1-type ATP synthase epsilon subunit
VADDRVSVLAAHAQLGGEVDIEEARRELASALAEGRQGEEDSPAVRYARARLRAAGHQE